MLDTKLKNRHKLAVFLIIITITLPALIMADNSLEARYEMQERREQLKEDALVSETFIEKFADVCYVLYNKEQTGGFADFKEENGHLFMDYDVFESCLDYRVVDEKGEVVSKTMATSSGYPAEGNLNSYAIGMSISFDAYGMPAAVISQGDYRNERSRILTRKLGDYFDESTIGMNFSSAGEEDMLKTPENRTYYLAMKEENMEEYLDSLYDIYGAHVGAPGWFVNLFLSFMVAVAAAAILLPKFRSLRTGEERIFKMPFEIPAIAAIICIAASADKAEDMVRFSGDYYSTADFLMWAFIFAVVYWSAASLRYLFAIGVKRGFGECTLTVPVLKYVKKIWKQAVSLCRRWFDRLYRSFDDLDFGDKNNKAILKLVFINFALLAVISCMWFAGIIALIVYSIILYFILQKYFNDLKGKYACLLKATNQMAQGKLDVEITEDLGVFNPFKAEIAKIQDGYQKAVEKEVKSQRMKTELVTNVSHDLKTPLTAIITYVNLLKEERDEEKRADYIDVLERKSLRLKVLIEDLFEISKASSRNITLNYVDVDVVNLFKQVRLEHAEKFEKAGLDFRCTYPEERAIARLDSQKTYRIFENLLVNVAKYALPNTRVYVKVEKTEEEVILRIMNISATELSFNVDEITERFVRGDASRNTEGSGLGLAIAKSFTELQKGRFKIETEGDLFKAEAAFPCV